MTRLLISACYVGSNFVAALIVVSLIVRNVPAAARAEFFVFQALFYPMVSIASQARMFLNYNNVESSRALWVLDFGIGLLLFSALYYLIGDSLGTVSLAMLSVSVLFSYKAAAEIAKIQFNNSDLRYVAIPLITMLARIIVCYVLMACGAGFVQAFFFSTAIFYLTPIIFSYFRGATDKATSGSNNAAQQNSLYFLFFVSVAFFFQWDRILTGILDLPELVETSGVYIILVLSPISLVFATIYRANAKSIFASDSSFQWSNYFSSAFPFVGLAVTYVAVLALFWQPINKLLFPFFVEGYQMMLLLSLAVVIDRLGLLLVYMAKLPTFYITSIITRLVLISSAFILFMAHSDRLSIENLYAAYAVMALCGFIVSLVLILLLAKPKRS